MNTKLPDKIEVLKEIMRRRGITCSEDIFQIGSINSDAAEILDIMCLIIGYPK